MKKLFWVILVCILLLLIIWFFRPQDSYQVKVKDEPKYQETTYTVIVKDKDWYQLITAQTELNKEIMAYGSNTVYIKPQLAPLRALLLKLIEREGKLRPVLLWRTTKGYPEFFVRVGAAVQKYPRELRSRQANELAVKIANELPAYPELKDFFNSLGYSIKVSSVEKVQINGTKEMPIDFMLWFRVEKNRE
jgi:hypothetical protein